MKKMMKLAEKAFIQVGRGKHEHRGEKWKILKDTNRTSKI